MSPVRKRSMNVVAALLAATAFFPGGEPLPAPGGAAEVPESAAETGATGTEETIVTARRRLEALGGVPLSVTAVDAKALEDYRLVEVSDLASRLPNTFFSEFSAQRLSFP